MVVVIRDVIADLDKAARVLRQKKRFILIDPFSLAALREEIGLEIEEDLTEYHGYTIKVAEDESELVQLI